MLLFSACTNHEEFDGGLSADSYSIEVGRDEGFTRIMVYGADSWRAEFVEEVEWATLDEFSYGSGRGSFRLNYSANEQLSRVAKVKVSGNGASFIVDVFQEAGKVLPTLTIAESAIAVPANRYIVTIPVTQTLLEDNLEHLVCSVATLDGEESKPCEWISNVALSEDLTSLEMEIARNDSGAERDAMVNVSLAGANKVPVFSRNVEVHQLAAEASLTATVESEYRHSPAEQQCVITIANNAGYVTRDANIEVEYLSSVEEWLDNIELGEESLVFSLSNNGGEEIREAKIRVWLTDADNNSTTPLEFMIRQGYFRTLTVKELRDIVTTDGYEFEDDFMSYSVEGVVVSDCDSKNNAMNPNTAYSTVDTSISDRTVYLQNEDGACGMCLLFTRAADNTFHRGDRLNIGLGGLPISVAENPKRYSIEGLTSASVVNHTEGGVTALAEKRKAISQLTDEDIYTYVTLSDMEFVFKQGAYTNVMEAYVQSSTLNEGTFSRKKLGDSPARLMQDRDGKTIFMQVNTLCQWRRTLNPSSEGNHGVPQGVGSLHGVVVADNNFRYGDRNNSIGRYSIRPIDESDIAGDNAIPWAASSARTTLAAWNFDNKTTGPEIHTPNTNGCPSTQYEWASTFSKKSSAINKLKASDGDTNALLYCNNLTSPADNVYTSWYTQLYSASGCNRPIFTDGYESAYIWDGLGEKSADVSGREYFWKSTLDTWCGTDAAKRGRDVSHHAGRNEVGDYTWVSNLNGWFDWDNDGATNGFVMELSTAGVSTPLTLNFSMGAGGNFAKDWSEFLKNFISGCIGYYSQNYPLYWKVQYSTDGGTTWVDGAKSTLTGETEFMLHPVPAWTAASYSDPASATAGGTAYPNAQMSLGLVEYSFELPAAASGQDNVLIRITPASKRVATMVAGAENYSMSLDCGVDATAEANYGNVIRFGGLSIQY